ncbi:hypothetical protein BDV23DRAFT_146960 [Aspergillus alliaceus]|uniref:Alpha/Beta hydrolase protein n=1 Tax=Petromyces alliaceus TaxID=209559 RepID=A0A5N7CM17_PETAA|nr:hypothetical protein BDV23DRAFT_146960 [Aspergillus alliaceus]
MSLDISIHIPSQREQIPCPKPTHQLCTHPSLAIYGNQDTFTSASKLNKWSDELSHAPRSQFRSAEIDGAGHFWREDGVESQARDALRNWLRLIPFSPYQPGSHVALNPVPSKHVIGLTFFA